MSAFDKALRKSKNLGIDECEIVFSKRKITTIRITDSEIAELKQNIDENYGVRLIKDKRIVAGQTSSEENIEKIIQKSVDSTSYIQPKRFWKTLPHSVKSHPILKEMFDKKLAEISGAQASDIAQEMINSASDEKINAISGSLNIVTESFNITNSFELNLSDNATYISGIINADSDFGGTAVSGMGHDSCRTLGKFNPVKIGQDAKIMCKESINPKRCEEGVYSIVFDPYSVGELLAFVFSSNFSLKFFSDKKSCFSNCFNQSIAVEDFSLIDDPHVPNSIGSKPFDDEGVTTSPNSLIKNGVFCGLYSDLYTAYKEGKSTSANASRLGIPMGRSSQPVPTSAPHNMKIESGDMSKDEIIKDTKHGLLVGRLWYTYAVNPIKGDFSCTARSGIRMIEDGEIKGSVKSFRIIHNLPVLLKNISAIGNNLRNIIQWSSLPSVTPSLRVEGIKVNPI